jgi:Family of unknown function (DUF6452)
MLKRIVYFLFVLLAVVTASCDDKLVCTELASSYLQAGCYQMVEGVSQDSVLNLVTLYGVGSDYYIFKDSSSVKQLVLPLDFESLDASFVLINDSVIDTLYVHYDTALTFLSYECGFAPTYKIDSVGFTKNGVDSISIVKSLVEAVDEENLEIYF